MASYSYHKWLLDKEILLYVLSTSKNKTFYVRFKNPLSKERRYVRKSTGHRNEALATAKAMAIMCFVDTNKT